MSRPPFTGALIALFVATSAVGSNAEPAKAPPGFELARLEAFYGNLTPTECARIYLSFLEEELAQPTPKHRGIGNGFITHDYVLAQIVRGPAEATRRPDRDILVLAAADADPGTFRDCIRLTLGLLGDRSVVPFLIAYLVNRNNSPFLRENAARALGECPDARAIPVLVAALSDPHYVVSHRLKCYDIRILARRALNRLKQVGIQLPAEAQRALDNVVTAERIPRKSEPPR